VSIVIMAHSVRHELERCLDSIERHAGTAVETILVDNASTDGTVEWVRSTHPDVHVVPLEENLGLAARQPGIERARGEFAMFLDSDAVLCEGALPAMVAALRANPDWGLIGPKLVYDDGSLQLSCRRFPPPVLPWLRRPPLARFFEDSRLVRRHLMEDDDHSRPREVVYVLGACQLFRMSLARAAGPLADYFFWPDDADWCIRIRDAGGRVVYFPDAVVIHSYRRMTSRSPLSRAALRHVGGFYAFQWQYRRRRRELERLGERLDREAPFFAQTEPGAGPDNQGPVYSSAPSTKDEQHDG
jgi:N-acetylglucosaminyl-diphospho-decaprenol L-rhamnosyltransferase